MNSPHIANPSAPGSSRPDVDLIDRGGRRAFDFRIGEWNVFAANGSPAGTNSIQPAEYGCLLIERWADVNALTGQSYNFLGPGTGKWRQVWVSGGSVIDCSGGLAETGAMQLEGTVANQAAGKSCPSEAHGRSTPTAP